MVKVSVVIPTYNRLARLKNVLANLERQSYPHDAFEVVVVSDGSSDGTVEFLLNLETELNFVFEDQENQGAAAARNKGVELASGEYILFLDDDVVPDSDLVRVHMAYHANGDGNLVVLGPMLTPTDYTMPPWVSWEQRMLYKQYDDMTTGRWQPTARQFYTGNASLARTYLLQAGGFDVQFRRAEDVELAYRLEAFDLEYVFAQDAIGYHYADRSFRSWLATPYSYGRNDVIFSIQKNQDWLLPKIFREFGTRHILTRSVVRTFLDKPRLSQWVIQFFKGFGQFASSFRAERLAHMAYSCIFNLRYYRGVADELGSADALITAIDEAH